MSGDEIRDMRRQRKAQVLLEIHEQEGTLMCLRRRLVEIQERLDSIKSAIERRLNPGLIPGFAPSMNEEGVLLLPTPLPEDSLVPATIERVDAGGMVRELGEFLEAYRAADEALKRLRSELAQL